MASAALKQTLSGPGDFAKNNHGVFGHFVNASKWMNLSSPPMIVMRSTELLWQCLRLHAVPWNSGVKVFLNFAGKDAGLDQGWKRKATKFLASS